MNLPEYSLKNHNVAWLIIGFLFVGGVSAFFKLGKLEDPTFSIKTAQVITQYPGASPKEVDQEITDVIEAAAQKLPQLKELESISKAGVSIVKVHIQEQYWSDKLPQIWDELRKHVSDSSGSLPPGAGEPIVYDSFGDVYGFVAAIYSDDFTLPEIEDYVTFLQKEMALVPGVARVEIWGAQPETIVIEVSNSRLSAELMVGQIYSALNSRNRVVDAGTIESQGMQMKVIPSGGINSVEEIGNILLTNESYSTGRTGISLTERSQLYIKDVATIKKETLSPPRQIMRYNGKPALALYISNQPGVNVAQLGADLDAKLDELMPFIPIGIEIGKMSWQSEIINNAISSFMINLLQAIVIVLAVISITMGIKMATIIGVSGLLLAILGTFTVMNIFAIDLHRISLGALIVAMGMMVDNAIVVVDGIAARVRRGMSKREACIEAASAPALPLLGATIIAVMAFYPIYSSPAAAGEFARTLFLVVGITLMISWALSQTVTPFLCMAFLREEKLKKRGNGGEYNSRFFRGYGKLIKSVLANRRKSLIVLIAALLLSLFGFRYVKVVFFPDATRDQFVVDYFGREGTAIETTSECVERMEEWLFAQKEDVKNVTTFIGQGPPRFYLPVSQEDPASSYAQLVITTTTFDTDDIINRFNSWAQDNISDGIVIAKKYAAGPNVPWKVEARFVGPANASPETLRRIGTEALGIVEKSSYKETARLNWGEEVLTMKPLYNSERGSKLGFSIEDLASASKRGYEGVTIGVYREGDTLLPIKVRLPSNERENYIGNYDLFQVRSQHSPYPIPVAQLIDGVDFQWEDAMIRRFNRGRSITVQANPVDLASSLLNDIRGDIKAIELPPGYRLEWVGEEARQKESNEGLKPGLPVMLLAIVFILVLLFNEMKPIAIIAGLIPFVMIGITGGLLLLRIPFGFMSILGALSLIGMMVKNIIVLLDEVKLLRSQGIAPYDALIQAGFSRLNPVVLAAATTILGMVPLLKDIFWVSMACTIMFGLFMGTALTLIGVPLLYSILYKVECPKKGESREQL